MILLSFAGGPALNLRNEVVGIAFQSLFTGDSDNIGYLVAESVVDHFLRDYEKNNRYTGFCHCGFQWQRMENISLRRSMNMKDGENGILVRRVNKTSPAVKVLRANDIVCAIDGIAVSNAGTVPYRSGERISFHYIITTKFTGDTVKLRILRDGKAVEIEYALGEIAENSLVPVNEHRRQPEYLTVAGLVFVALSEPYLAAEYGEKWDLVCAPRLLAIEIFLIFSLCSTTFLLSLTLTCACSLPPALWNLHRKPQFGCSSAWYTDAKRHWTSKSLSYLKF